MSDVSLGWTALFIFALSVGLWASCGDGENFEPILTSVVLRSSQSAPILWSSSSKAPEASSRRHDALGSRTCGDRSLRNSKQGHPLRPALARCTQGSTRSHIVVVGCERKSGLDGPIGELSGEGQIPIMSSQPCASIWTERLSTDRSLRCRCELDVGTSTEPRPKLDGESAPYGGLIPGPANI